MDQRMYGEVNCMKKLDTEYLVDDDMEQSFLYMQRQRNVKIVVWFWTLLLLVFKQTVNFLNFQEAFLNLHYFLPYSLIF